MKTSDKLIYTASKIKGNEKIDITIRLDENVLTMKLYVSFLS
jgi:hypothetical protein